MLHGGGESMVKGPGSWLLTVLHNQEAESKQDVGPGYKILNLDPRGQLPLARLHCKGSTNISNSTASWRASI